jgi:hypothetical protein
MTTQSSAPTQPVFCTVIEPQRNWVNAATLLVQSLRRNGGAHGSALFVILVNDLPNMPMPFFRDNSLRLIVGGNRRHPILPHLSKALALDLEQRLPFTHLILLDHDTLILHLNELASFLTSQVHARRNYKYGLSRALGNDYARHLSAPGIPKWRQIRYFNSGVVIVPRPHCSLLRDQWLTWGEKLIQAYQGRPLAEQLGFSMALASAKIPYQCLPMNYNRTNWKPPSSDAAIIHYNAYDRINREVKRTALNSFESFCVFLRQTDNRFWRAYAPKIEQLVDPDLYSLSDRIFSAIHSKESFARGT